MCVVMQTLEIIGGKIWSLLMSRAAEIKRKSRKGTGAESRVFTSSKTWTKSGTQGYKKEMLVASTLVITTELEMYGGH